LKAPAYVRFPVLVKSVFKAGVPEYNILIVSALSVHDSLKAFSRFSGNFSNGDILLEPDAFNKPSYLNY
jgi:hypothetical protein